MSTRPRPASRPRPAGAPFAVATLPLVILRAGRERSVLQRHPWVFSGAVAQVVGNPRPGDFVAVRALDSSVLGLGAYNPGSQIRVRMLTFGPDLPADPAGLLLHRVERAVARRAGTIDPTDTDCLRLVNAEGDGVPGLVADLYASELVVQPGARYLEGVLEPLVKAIARTCAVRGVRLRVEKGVRELEGLVVPDGPFVAAGFDAAASVEVREHGLRYHVDLEAGQKTGFFLDQRENRLLVRRYARGKRVLNLFSYTGGFSLNAHAAGAASVLSVDTSPTAMKTYAKNRALNGFEYDDPTYKGDVAHFFRDLDAAARFDLVVCDPPAFARTHDVVNEAARAYKDVNRRAMRLLDDGLLMTFSCSSHVPPRLFRQVLFQAGVEAGREVRVLATLGAAPDHPVDLYHPEGEYLKGALLQVSAP